MCVRKKRKAQPDAPSLQNAVTPRPQKVEAVAKKVEKSPAPPVNLAQTSVPRPDPLPTDVKTPLQPNKASTAKTVSAVKTKSEKNIKSPESAILGPNETMPSVTVTAAVTEAIAIDPPREMKVKRKVDGKRDPQDPEYRTLPIGEPSGWDSAKLMSRLELKRKNERPVDSEECK